MIALCRHELRAGRVLGWRTAWLGLFGLFLLLAALTTPNWQLSGLVALGSAQASVVCATFGLALRHVRREGRQGTLHLWLRLGPTALARLGAKAVAALLIALAWFAAIAVVLTGFLVAYRLPLARQGLAPLLGRSPTLAATLRLAWQWLPRDLALLFALAPLFAAAGLVLGLGLLVRRHEGAGQDRRLQAPVGIVAWVAVWLIVGTVVSHIGPVFHLVRRHGEMVLQFLPAARVDATVAVLPDLRVTLWPVFLAWALALALYASASWFAGSERFGA